MFPNMMWLCFAVSLVASSMALTAPVSFLQERIAVKANEDAHPTSSSFLDTLVLSDESYKRVAELQDDVAMEKFIRRLLLAHGKTVSDEGALKGFVPWFSGTKATQNLPQMKEQLFKKQWVVDASAREEAASKNKCGLECLGGKSQHMCKLRHCQACFECAPWFQTSCGSICHAADHMDVPWVFQNASGGAAGKCTWHDCSTCPECTTQQNLKPVADIAKHGFNEAKPRAHGTQPLDVSASVEETKKKGKLLVKAKMVTTANSSSSASSAMTIEHVPMAALSPPASVETLPAKTKADDTEENSGAHSSRIEDNGKPMLTTPPDGQEAPVADSSAPGSETASVVSTPPGSVEAVPAKTKPDETEERYGGTSSRAEARWKPMATTPAVRQEAPVNVPSSPRSATVPVAATRPESVETLPAKEELSLGVQSLVDSQSQIVIDFESKISQLKAKVGKAESSIRESLDEAKTRYERKLLEQHMNTTRLLDINHHLEEDIKMLVSSNAELRQHAQELKMQSLALRVQVTAAESNLTLAQEFAAKVLLDDSNADFQFLMDLRRNESELAKTYSHSQAVDHFGEKNSMALLQRRNGTETADFLHTVEHVDHLFSEFSVQAGSSKLALEQYFEQSFNHEARVQESILTKQRVLLGEKEEQLALRSKLADAVAHADKIKTFLDTRILRLKSYALRLSRR